MGTTPGLCGLRFARGSHALTCLEGWWGSLLRGTRFGSGCGVPFDLKENIENPETLRNKFGWVFWVRKVSMVLQGFLFCAQHQGRLWAPKQGGTQPYHDACAQLGLAGGRGMRFLFNPVAWCGDPWSQVLGDGLDQRGSLVTADRPGGHSSSILHGWCLSFRIGRFRLRFDFSYEASNGVSVTDLEKVETLVSWRSLEVTWG